jgi:hypothetical protein
MIRSPLTVNRGERYDPARKKASSLPLEAAAANAREFQALRLLLSPQPPTRVPQAGAPPDPNPLLKIRQW